MAWCLAGRCCLLFFQLFKAGPSVIRLSLFTSLCMIHLTSFYGCRCFGHKHYVKKKRKRFLIVLINVSWFCCFVFINVENRRTWLCFMQHAAAGGGTDQSRWHRPGQRAASGIATLHSVLLGRSHPERREEKVLQGWLRESVDFNTCWGILLKEPANSFWYLLGVSRFFKIHESVQLTVLRSRLMI